MTLPFCPSRIFVDRAVIALPLTRWILEKFHGLPIEIIDNPRSLKRPSDFTQAKKTLLLARKKAEPIREFGVMQCKGEASLAPTVHSYSLDLISNCPLECSYCILQSYLANNPALTIFTNIEEILEHLQEKIRQIPEGSVIGTGRIADSLALDPVSEHNRHLVPFFSRQTRVRLELKTKTNRIEDLLKLDHGGRAVVSWTMSPPEIIQREEFKTASFEKRLEAARRVSEVGYPLAFHFDPLILHDGWRENYEKIVGEVFRKVPSERVAWISVGTLRFPTRQARIMRKRFPKNLKIHEGLISTNRTFLHYPDGLREEMQSFVEALMARYLPRSLVYRCMDSP